MKSFEALEYLNKQQGKNWYDLGVFLDQLPRKRFAFGRKLKNFNNFESYLSHVGKGTILYLTYYLRVDGVSIELDKYLGIFSKLCEGKNNNAVVVGSVDPHSFVIKGTHNATIHTIPAVDGFERWGEAYDLLFKQKMKAGGEVYNILPGLIWRQTLLIFEQLSALIEKDDVRLLVGFNTASNPGNLAYTLAIIIASELYGIPVINFNYDFYWEDGDFQKHRRPGEKGVRDHFFTNLDNEEIYALIKTLYPWRSPLWMHVNANIQQTERLIAHEGLNPVQLTESASCVDTDSFRRQVGDERMTVFIKLQLFFRSLFQSETQALAYTDEEVFSRAQESQPTLVGYSSKSVDFVPDETVVLLQPTRILERKQIEWDFTFIEHLFGDADFSSWFLQHNKKLLLIITGPIEHERLDYFRQVYGELTRMYTQLDQQIADRVYVGFKFGKDQCESLVYEGHPPLLSNELYGVADLVLLPSKTEGIGLPVIEAAAAGCPLLVNTFIPEETYAEMVEGLEVFTFEEVHDPARFAQLRSLIQAPSPKVSSLIHNNRTHAVHKHGVVRLIATIKNIFYKYWLFSKEDGAARASAKALLSDYVRQHRVSLSPLAYDRNRTYFPGYIPLGFSFTAKSINCPPYFRTDFFKLKSRIYSFARQLVDQVTVDTSDRFRFFQTIDMLFETKRGVIRTYIDHSLNFRYRTKKRYLFHELTEHEMYGLIVTLSKQIFGKDFDPFRLSRAKSKALDVLLKEVGSSQVQAMSSREYFSSSYGESQSHSYDAFVAVVKQRKKLSLLLSGYRETVQLMTLLGKLIEEAILPSGVAIDVVVAKLPFFDWVTGDDFKELLRKKRFLVLQQLGKRKRLKVIHFDYKSLGLSLYSVKGTKKHYFEKLKKESALVVALGQEHFLCLDLLDLDSVRMGEVRDQQFAQYIGTPGASAFFAYVPAGLRPVLAYPYPIQQLPDFNKAVLAHLNTDTSFWEAVKLSQDGACKPVLDSIQAVLKQNETTQDVVETFQLSGQSSLPWTGACSVIDLGALSRDSLQLSVVKADQKALSLMDFVHLFEGKHPQQQVVCGFNGGFILTHELIGKMNLSREYLNAPLGLLVQGGEVQSLPLYYRPALIMTKDKKVSIQRVHLQGGRICVKGYEKESMVTWTPDLINRKVLKENQIGVYNLLYDTKVSTQDRVLVTFCGRRIASVYSPRLKTGASKELISVGITISFPEQLFRKRYITYYQEGREVDYGIDLPYPHVEEAIGGGPLLLHKGKISLNMESEGWTTSHSLRTQANRNDRISQMGPKIGVGLDTNNHLWTFVINGRLRDSFGVSYVQLAEIMQSYGIYEAMAFDPGGSTSLYAHGKMMNITSYTEGFQDIHAHCGPSSPRPVGNAVLLSIPVSSELK